MRQQESFGTRKAKWRRGCLPKIKIFVQALFGLLCKTRTPHKAVSAFFFSVFVYFFVRVFVSGQFQTRPRSVSDPCAVSLQPVYRPSQPRQRSVSGPCASTRARSVSNPCAISFQPLSVRLNPVNRQSPTRVPSVSNRPQSRPPCRFLKK